MKINGIEIPDSLLIGAGWTPPQEFEYPLYRRMKDGLVCEFTGLTTMKVLKVGTGSFSKGEVRNSIFNHEHPYWIPCEKPKPEPKPLQFDGTPVWAYVSNDPNRYEYGVKVKNKRHVVACDGDYFVAIHEEGTSNTESICTEEWQYAWEIPEDEA